MEGGDVAGGGQVPDDFDVGRFRMLTTVSGACFAGFMGLMLCTMFGWFGRPQWWWMVMLGTFGLGLWFSHREAGLMRSELLSNRSPSSASASPIDSTVTAERPVLQRYCSSCQAPVRRDIPFCTSCGEHLGEHGGYFE